MHTKNNIWKHNIAVCILNKYRTTNKFRSILSRKKNIIRMYYFVNRQ